MPRGALARPVMERLMNMVTKTESGCWEYASQRAGRDYRQVNVIEAGKTVHRYAHRVAYEHLAGAVPEGMQLDHLCRNRVCINPAHLEPVTPKENVQRARALVTHCPSGHPYDAENSRIYQGRRYCRTCQATRKTKPRTAEQNAARRAKRAAARASHEEEIQVA